MPFPNVGAQVLDGPPPSPQLQGGGPTGAFPTSLAGLAPASAGMDSTALPPEILQGVMQAAVKIGDMLDSFSQVTPDLQPDWQQIKDLLQTTLAKLITAGAPPLSPTATGPAFPGGGLDRGISRPGSA